MLDEVVSGRYRIVARIGAGGMGEVYEAEDLELPRKVALKFLTAAMSDDRRLRQRFLREAEAISALDHPHICTIYETGETDDGRMFIAMPYYQGETLKQRLSRNGVSMSDAVAFAVAIADGMDKAHRRGILHRDLKPGNVIVTEDGVVKILDFGLAKLPDRTQITETGMAVGTMAYAAPEQIKGEPLDARSDVYSLGVILYQMITGVSPFRAASAAATLHRVLNDTPPSAGRVRAGIPPKLEALIERCMAKDPAQRPDGMAQVREELIDVLTEIAPSQATRLRTEHIEPGARRRRRRRLAISAVLVAVAALVAGNLQALRSRLGRGDLPPSRGVAVVPFRAEDAASGSDPILSGLWLDVAARATRLSERDPDLWVLPPATIGDVAPEQMGPTFGVDAVLTGLVRVADGMPSVELRVLDARAQRSLRSSLWSWSTTGAMDLDERLAELLEIELDVAGMASLDSGSTQDPLAYVAFLRGLGTLGPAGAEGADEAFGHFEAAVAQDSTFAMARVRLAETFLRKFADSDDLQWAERASTHCQKALELGGESAAAHAMLASVRTRTHDGAGAVRELEQAVASSPRNPQYRRLLGWAQFQQGSRDAAEGTFRAAILANPRYFGVYEDLGYYHYALGRHQEAIVQFELAVALAPRYGLLYNYLGGCLYALERWDEATAMFEKSFGLGRNYQACSNLGTLYYLAGRFEDAARMYEWAYEYDQSNHMVAGNLASALFWIPDQRERSLRSFEEAIRLGEVKRRETPDDAVLLAYLAIYYSVTDSIKAAGIAQDAVEKDPDNPEVLYRAALAYEQIGQRTKALKALGGAIERGYSTRVVSLERQLQDLREDPRYRLLLP